MRLLTLALIAALALLSGTASADTSRHKKQMIVTFAIQDYAAWRPVFDAAAPARAGKGVTNAHVYRDADSPNNLLVVFDVASKKDARAWMTSSQVQTDWQKGGVVGTPSYKFAD